MSPTIIGNVRMAVATLKAAKLRSFLTMLGVIIGVVSVVTVVSIGEGIKNQVSHEINRLGRDLITVRPGDATRRQDEKSSLFGDLQALTTTVNSGSLSAGDEQIVEKTPGVRQAVPLGLVGGDIKVDGKDAGKPLILATSAGMDGLLNDPLEYGEFFEDGDALADQPNVAVIGSDTANRLFGERSPLGSSFELLGQTFFVRGVFKQFDATPLSLTTDFNDVIVVPYKTAQALTNNNVPLFEILAKPSDPGRLQATVDGITQRLDDAHKGQQRFSVLSQEESLAVTNEILDLLTWLIAGIAAISLLVGGIGIMDVMLVSVAERMHEIGLRKALGASNRQIMLQFLTESAVLSFAGGVIGVVISLLINFTMRVTTPITPAFSWWAIAISVGVSLVVGVIFGTMPALKAARKDPIEALRGR